MLFWSKYLITDRIDNDVILWSTINSKGFIIQSQSDDIVKSVSEGIWYDDLNVSIKNKLIDNGFLLSEEQQANESKLIEKMRAEAVFDDTFMSLTIVPTDKCNFKCLYCYQSDTYHNMSNDVATSIVKMINKNKSLKKLHISWFGGEPLCNKQLVISLMEDINKICKEKGIILISDMTTNASLLDLETFSRLYSLKVLNYQITIDGCKKTHDIQRPLNNNQSSFDLIMKNLRDIRDNAKGNFFKIGIRTNFTSFVDSHFEEMKNILIDEFANDNRFYFFFQWVKDWGGNRVSLISNELLKDDEAISHYGRWMDTMSKTQVRTGDIAMIRACSGLCIGCRKNSYLINTDGTICKCTTGIYDDKYKNKSIIGYIDNQGNRIIDKWKEIDWLSCDSELEECKECNLYPICLGMPCPYYKIKHGKVICNKNDSYIKYMIRSMARQGYIDIISDEE